VDALISFSGTCFLAALAFVCASFRLQPRLGRFKPVPLLLGLFFCYNALPFIIVSLMPDLTEVLLASTFTYYRPDNLDAIGVLVLACTCAGFVGQLAATPRRRFRPVRERVSTAEQTPLRPPASGRKLVFAAFWSLALIAAAMLWQLREFLFSGYHESFGDDQGEVLLRGSLSSVFSLLFVSYLFLWYSDDRRRPQKIDRLFWVSTGVIAGVAAGLLSMGGRLYIASAAITFISLRLSRANPSALQLHGRWKSMLGTVALIGAAASVGIWRSQRDFTVAAVFANLLAEPLYVSISLASLFASNSIPALQFPFFLLEDAVGLLPGSLYPAKLERFFAIGNAYAMESPVGGLSGMASLVANFGWLGTILVIGLLCFTLTRISQAVARRPGSRAPQLAFVIAATFPLLSLLRDPFVVSFYKNLLQNSLLWPCLLTLAVGTRLVRKNTSIEQAPSPALAGKSTAPSTTQSG
jgi:hypothetical protein